MCKHLCCMYILIIYTSYDIFCTYIPILCGTQNETINALIYLLLILQGANPLQICYSSL